LDLFASGKARWLGVAPLAAGILVTLTARPPDLLVSEDGKLVAIRLDNGGIALSNRLHDKFTQSVWVRRAGEGEIEDNPPATLDDTSQTADCGGGLCRFTVAGHKAAIVSKPEALAGGCAASDVVIAQLPAHAACRAPLVIDPTDLARDGAISVRFEKDLPIVQTVRASAGNRPWTAPALAGP